MASLSSISDLNRSGAPEYAQFIPFTSVQPQGDEQTIEFLLQQVERCNSLCARLTTQITVLERQKSRITDAHHIRDIHLERAHENLEERNAVVEFLSTKLRAATDTIAALQEKVQGLDAEKESYQEAVHELRGLLREAKQNVSDLTEQLRQASSSYSKEDQELINQYFALAFETDDPNAVELRQIKKKDGTTVQMPIPPAVLRVSKLREEAKNELEASQKRVVELEEEIQKLLSASHSNQSTDLLSSCPLPSSSSSSSSSSDAPPALLAQPPETDLKALQDELQQERQKVSQLQQNVEDLTALNAEHDELITATQGILLAAFGTVNPKEVKWMAVEGSTELVPMPLLLERAKNEIATLKEERGQLQTAVSQLQLQIEQLQSSQGSSSGAGSELATLQEQLETTKAESLKRQEKIERLERNYKRLTETHEAAQLENGRLHKALEGQEQALLKKLNDKYQIKIARVEQELLKRLEDENAQLKQQLETAQQTNETAQSRISDLESYASESEASIKVLQGRVGQYATKEDELLARIRELEQAQLAQVEAVNRQAASQFEDATKSVNNALLGSLILSSKLGDLPPPPPPPPPPLPPPTSPIPSSSQGSGPLDFSGVSLKPVSSSSSQSSSSGERHTLDLSQLQTVQLNRTTGPVTREFDPSALQSALTGQALRIREKAEQTRIAKELATTTKENQKSWERDFVWKNDEPQRYIANIEKLNREGNPLVLGLERSSFAKWLKDTAVDIREQQEGCDYYLTLLDSYIKENCHPGENHLEKAVPKATVEEFGKKAFPEEEDEYSDVPCAVDMSATLRLDLLSSQDHTIYSLRAFVTAKKEQLDRSLVAVKDYLENYNFRAFAR